MTPSATDSVVPRPRLRRGAAEHWAWLIIASAVVALSFVLEVRGTEQVGTALGPDVVLPNLCLYRAGLGVNCPGCGLTRSFLYLARGDLAASWQMHRLGWILALAVVGQIPYRIYRLCRPGKPIRLPQRAIALFGCGLGLVFIGNWLIGLLLERPGLLALLGE